MNLAESVIGVLLLCKSIIDLVDPVIVNGSTTRQWSDLGDV
jgi:hypothetical protein